jgi:hypothetical protein
MPSVLSDLGRWSWTGDQRRRYAISLAFLPPPARRNVVRVFQCLDRKIKPGQIGLEDPRELMGFDEGDIPASCLDFDQRGVVPPEMLRHSRCDAAHGHLECFSLRYQSYRVKMYDDGDNITEYSV